MERKDRFSPDIQPEIEVIGEFISSPLWDELRIFIERTYEVQPSIEYSKCSLETGWNVKYKKGSRALCTVYPQENSFTCLVTVGKKEAEEAELLLPSLSSYVQEVYSTAGSLNGARWLMINVTSQEILEDIKRLILIRVKPKKK